MILLRSTIFNLVFYGATALACLLCLPSLLLPRKGVFFVIHAFVYTVHFFEKYILGLTYEVRGAENLPQDGSYIVAAKHQSPYETMKLHILFKDPAIVLKRELLSIPLWGRFLARTNPIAIDRKQGKEAMNQVVDGAKRVKEENRAIVIFPQGTRVYPWQTIKDKPYKSGIVRMYTETSMPVVPLALNTGLFWPRKSWIKRPGKVIFQFMPPVRAGMDAETFTKTLQDQIETTTEALQQEALATNKYLVPPTRPQEA